MSIPKVSEQDILKALDYIDKEGVPFHNMSTKYVLVAENGKKYPPKYVISVADHFASGNEINTDSFNAVEAKNYLQKAGFTIELKQEEYILTIEADSVTSTDERFTMDNLSLGDGYKPLDAFFVKANGEKIKRKREKGENRISNQTLPRIACQVFENQIVSLSDYDKKNFPICQYDPNSAVLRGIFGTPDEYKKWRNTNSIEYATYKRENGPQFIFYSWNIFSTIIFVQECLKRFGEKGDSFVLLYREKNDTSEENQNSENAESTINENQQTVNYRNSYSYKLINSKNIIFRGAPGTGKSYLAKEIATDIITNGYEDKYEALTEDQKQQVEFVQFHPNYDYSDFVEGLRPKINSDGTMGFELRDGIFKSFVARARKNYENSLKTEEVIEKELSVQESMAEFLSEAIELGKEFITIRGNAFYITDIDEKHIYISVPNNERSDKVVLNINELRQMLEADENFDKVTEVVRFFKKQNATQQFSYDLVLYNEIKKRKVNKLKQTVRREKLKKYIFIIDEINRGEISKILGELFFSIDPGYRGKAGEIATQYSNMHEEEDGKFYIPENVYIIGTMNDIDRSVDSFDFAMRRRFRFIEIKADERLEMLNALDNEDLKNEAIKRMTSLNDAIVKTDDLNENYQIGAAYFLKLKDIGFDELWTDCLKPLLKDYVQGMYEEDDIMGKFERAYGYKNQNEGLTDESVQD